ncbi:MAG TPA: HAD family hydrolase [Opitutaceae bacterium]|nr:HAD family hydrolase [Opitutaceae bacterium]
MKRLLLWDIDGTLITSGGAGMRALRAALQQVFAIDGAIDDIDFAGRTDRWIMRQILARFGLPATEENFLRYAEGYVAALPAELADRGVQPLPGVPAVLQAALARRDTALGLLTGNLRRGAAAKLASRDLWRYFPFGAFADDSEDRNQLGPIALRRARAHHGVDFVTSNTWVIGDTPHDVVCARAFGARALAVATGRHSRDQLMAERPDAAMSDLSDPAPFWRLIDAA